MGTRDAVRWNEASGDAANIFGVCKLTPTYGHRGKFMQITIRYFEAEISEAQVREIVEPFGEVTKVTISETKFPDKRSATVEMPVERLQADVIANKIKRIERNGKKLIAFAVVDDENAVQA